MAEKLPAVQMEQLDWPRSAWYLPVSQLVVAAGCVCVREGGWGGGGVEVDGEGVE